jgi:hypothetical protein
VSASDMTMDTPVLRRTDDASPPLFGVQVIRDIRTFLLRVIGLGIVYGTFVGGSRGGCAGGIDGSGGFLDATGRATDVAPLCWSAQMRPGPLVFLALGIVVVWALTRVTRRAANTEQARRILFRASLIALGIVLVAFAVAYAWFFLGPLGSWEGEGALWLPFGFASVDVDVQPMSAP